MAVKLNVATRELRPRSIKNNLRQEGQVIGSVYGYQVESTPVSVDKAELKRAIREHGTNTVFTFELEGKTVNALIAEQQLDTFNREWVNVDFYSANMNEKTEIAVELVINHEDDAIKATGGVLTQNIYEVIVSATPDNIPEYIAIDAKDMKIGDSVTVADLPKDSKYDIVTDGEEVIIALEEKQEIEEEETDAAAAAPAEPEVIGEDKEV